ncbi:hypothetical protein ACSSS7_004026 [Eimeria intestinalis]
MYRELTGCFSSFLRSSARLPFKEKIALRPPLSEGAAARLPRRRLTGEFSKFRFVSSDGRRASLSSSQHCVTCRCVCSSAEAPLEGETWYTKSHEYVRFTARDSSKAVVGVTEFAAEELGEVAFVEAFVSGDSEDARVNKGDPVCTLEALKSVAEVYAPVSGRVLKFNEKVKEDPALISRDPEGEGWIFLIDVDPIEKSTEEHSRQDAVKRLLFSAAEYAAYVNREFCDSASH